MWIPLHIYVGKLSEFKKCTSWVSVLVFLKGKRNEVMNMKHSHTLVFLIKGKYIFVIRCTVNIGETHEGVMHNLM